MINLKLDVEQLQVGHRIVLRQPDINSGLILGLFSDDELTIALSQLGSQLAGLGQQTTRLIIEHENRLWGG